MYVLDVRSKSDPDSSASAEALASLDWHDGQARVAHGVFGKKDVNCFPRKSLHLLRNLVFIGHAGTTRYGDFTAAKFAQKFLDEFKAAGYSDQDKMQVQHLNLIGCGIGMAANGKPALAQEIANELDKRGFRNIQVHSVANPDNIPPDSQMIVEVTNRAGVSVIAGNRPGFIKAYVLNSVQSRELDALEEQLAKAKKTREKISIKNKIEAIKKNAICFIPQANPVDELQKPQNIFIPNEKPAARRVRIETHPDTVAEKARIRREAELTEAKSRVISLLEGRREHEREKLQELKDKKEGAKDKVRDVAHHPVRALGAAVKMPFVVLENAVEGNRLKELMENLDLLIEALKQSRNGQWQNIITENLPLFELTVHNLFGLLDVSTTLDMLRQLARGQVPSEEVAVQGKDERKQKEKEERKKSADRDPEREPLLTGDKRPSPVRGVSPARRIEREPAPAANTNGRDPQLEQFRSEITALRDRYIRQIGEFERSISRSCFGFCAFFSTYEMNTKIAKRDALNQLLTATSGPDATLADLQRLAGNVIRNGGRVMRSKNTHETENLLDRIVKFNSNNHRI